jgi:hypothetical protein
MGDSVERAAARRMVVSAIWMEPLLVARVHESVSETPN